MKVAIVGFAKSSRDAAPYDDPSWSVWGVNGTWAVVPRLDVILDLHAPWIYEWEPYRRPAGHVAHLQAFSGAVYLIEAREDMPTSRAYPLAEVVAGIGRPYLTSSVALAIGLALLDPRVDAIGLWGVEMATASEYADQRPCVEWLLGLAEARGIAVVLPEGCSLLSGPLYGRGDLNSGGERLTPSQFERRLAMLVKREGELSRQAARLDGGIAEIEHILTLASVPPSWTERAEQMRSELVATLEDLARVRGMVAEARYWLAQTPEGASQDIVREMTRRKLAVLDGGLQAGEEVG